MIVKPGFDTNTKTIVIIGVQRGGTSMVAGIARELGVNLGRNLGNNHEDPEFITEDLQAIKKVVAHRDAKYNVWGWKMPHSSEYIVRLLPHLRNPFVIVVFRNLAAIAESQMKQSDVNFRDAFSFSATRLAQVASATQEIDCPLMIVNYERAVLKPSNLLDELCAFLHLRPSEDERERALAMTDPQRGYVRTKKEDWTARVSKAESFDFGSKDAIEAFQCNVGLSLVDNWIQKDGDQPHILLEGLAGYKRVYLSFVRRSAPAFIDLCVNTGDGYTDGLTDRIQLFHGENVITIDAESINGIAIYPQFDGAASNTGLFRITVDKA
ncbi:MULTISPECIES: hypothetical protein [unclassified Mesorhizobium]|uniref:hypothetical protein n=1 Tax=unclassified Mesorhizobium TaxID=325217 RepID=UPI0033380223